MQVLKQLENGMAIFAQIKYQVVQSFKTLGELKMGIKVFLLAFTIVGFVQGAPNWQVKLLYPTKL